MKTSTEAEELLRRLKSAGYDPASTQRPGLSYEQGIRDTLIWVYGSRPEFFEPMKEPGGWPWDESSES